MLAQGGDLRPRPACKSSARSWWQGMPDPPVVQQPCCGFDGWHLLRLSFGALQPDVETCATAPIGTAGSKACAVLQDSGLGPPAPKAPPAPPPEQVSQPDAGVVQLELGEDGQLAIQAQPDRPRQVCCQPMVHSRPLQRFRVPMPGLPHTSHPVGTKQPARRSSQV